MRYQAVLSVHSALSGTARSQEKSKILSGLNKFREKKTLSRLCPCLCYRNIQPVWAEKFGLLLNAFVTCETLSLSIYMATDNIYFLF